jgi:hypothetical protein
LATNSWCPKATSARARSRRTRTPSSDDARSPSAKPRPLRVAACEPSGDLGSGRADDNRRCRVVTTGRRSCDLTTVKHSSVGRRCAKPFDRTPWRVAC